MSITSKSLSAFFWDLSGTYLTSFASIVISIILANLIDPSEFGVIGIILAINGFFTVFVDSGFSNAIIQSNKITDNQLSTVFFVNLAIAILCALLLILSADAASVFFAMPDLKLPLQIMSSVLVINSLNTVQTSLYRKALDFKSLVKANIISVIVSGGVGVYMAFAGYAIWALVVQVIIASIIYSVALWGQSRWKPSLYFRWADIQGLWDYGSKILMMGVIEGLFNRVDVLLIGRVFSATDVGLFTRAKSFKQMSIQLSTSSMSKVLFPSFSKVQGDRERLDMMLTKVSKLAVSVITLVVGLMFLAAEDLFLILLNEKWLPAVPLFRLMVLAGIWFPLNSISVNYIKAIGESKLFLKLGIVKKSAMLPCFVIAYYYGIEAYLLSVIVVATLSYVINLMGIASVSKLSVFAEIKAILPEIILFGLSLTGLFVVLEYYKSSNAYLNVMVSSAAYLMIVGGYHILGKSSAYQFGMEQVGKYQKWRK